MTASLENPFAGQGAVLLDIGGDVGALVVTMPAQLEGIEIEIRPVGAQRHGPHDHPDDRTGEPDHGAHQHVAVVNRPIQGTHVPSLVFPELVEGRYELYEKGTHLVRLTVNITGGEVTSADWPR